MIKLTVTHKAWGIVIIIGAILFAANLAYPIFNYTLNTAYHCERCHKQQYKLWEDNKAHRLSISCVYCHTDRSSSEFVYMPERYYNRKDEIKERCVRCHTNYMDEEKAKAVTITLEAKDDITGEMKTVYGPISLNDVTCRDKFSCVYCHINLSHDRADVPTNLPRADYCVDCHTKYHDKDKHLQMTPRPTLVIIRGDGEKKVSPGIR